MTYVGTEHFKSLAHAILYYEPYFEGTYLQRKKFVVEKILKGEISLGRPEVKEGERLLVNSEGRYVIETPD